MGTPTKVDEKSVCKCGVNLVAKMTDYGGRFKDKLQWKNPDGKAHFMWTKDGMQCIPADAVEDKPSAPTQENLDSAPEPQTAKYSTLPLKQNGEYDGFPEFKEGEIKYMVHTVNKIKSIEKIVTISLTTEFNGSPVAPNSARVGMYVKLVLDMLEGANEKAVR